MCIFKLLFITFIYVLLFCLFFIILGGGGLKD